MNKVYTVFGQSGQYSDWRMWAVRAFGAKDDADTFAERLNSIVKRNLAAIEEADEEADYPAIDAAVAKYHKELIEAGEELAGDLDEWTMRGCNEPSYHVEEIDFTEATK
jgi:hypothetical protein